MPCNESDALRDHERRERATAEGIAYIAWRWRNPMAGDFNPIGDRGHRAMVDGAVAYLRDPAVRTALPGGES